MGRAQEARGHRHLPEVRGYCGVCGMSAARPAPSVIMAAAEAAKATGQPVVIEAPGGVRITFGALTVPPPPDDPAPGESECDQAFAAVARRRAER